MVADFAIGDAPGGADVGLFLATIAAPTFSEAMAFIAYGRNASSDMPIKIFSQVETAVSMGDFSIWSWACATPGPNAGPPGGPIWACTEGETGGLSIAGID